MSNEATVIFLFVAFIAFIVCAVLSWPWRNFGFFLGIGLAAWVLPELWTAIKAL